MTVTVESFDDRGVKEVELFVNGRPLPPRQARPITVDAKPIRVDARDLDPNYKVAKRFTYRVTLPPDEEIRLRAIAYDDTDLGSDPVEIVLKHANVKPVTGNLVVLSVGVGKYKNADGKGFKNLTYPAIDAKSIAERFQRESKPLYEQVKVRTLFDEQATSANVRDGLKWLQTAVQRGRVDTVVIFLSGHGVSSDEGRYFFATHEIEVTSKDAIARTSLSGRELREALGGKLDAKAVFLFLDTCHSGGLQGRNVDLANDVGEGVFIVASSGATQYSYESPEWGHGAFTLALLRTLAKKDLEDEGAIRFSDLISSVRREVKTLMKATGQNESQEPVVPLSGRSLSQPLAQAR